MYDITKTYPEVIDIMANLGFDEIKKPAMLNSVGRIMTIPKGAKAKGISIPVVIAELIKNGFEITGNMPDISSMGSKQFQAKETGNTVLLKDYLKRLGNGERKLHLKAVAGIHYEAMALYSENLKSLDDLKDGATIAVPNDGSNESRALAS